MTETQETEKEPELPKAYRVYCKCGANLIRRGFEEDLWLDRIDCGCGRKQFPALVREL